MTAYDEYALRAFEVRALDYILKPFSRDRLREALARATQRVEEASAFAASLEHGAPGDGNRATDARFLDRLVIRERDSAVVVPVRDIVWIEADTYYVRLHLADGKSRLLRERMMALESRLDPNVFFRTHRSAIVRLDCVRSVKTLSRYEHTVTLTAGARVPLSRERRARLAALLGGDW